MQSTINNRTIFCHDNLEILAGIDNESIDLIYLDPPFNKKKVFSAPIGSSAEGASFSDIFREEDIKEEWVLTIEEDNEKLHNFLLGIRQIDGRQSYNFCYLCYMSIRLIACHRVLKDTGSIYLHCDPTMSHYIKIVLDCVFGEQHFRNEAVWRRSLGHHLSKGMDTITDSILWYSKTENFIYKQQYGIVSSEELKTKFPYIEKETGRRFTHEKLEQTSNAYSQKEKRIIEGKTMTTQLGWRWTQKTFDQKLSENPHSIYWTSDGRPRYKRYQDEYLGRKVNNLWIDIQPIGSVAKERTGYPTQKPLALLERIIKASSEKGDVVLDPFCGCATTCIAAERLGRQWIGIDVSVKAYELVKERLQKEVSDPEDIFKHQNVVNYSTSVPKRTDLEDDYLLKKWVYVISNEAYCDEYKVGIARNWKSRLNSYQTSDPNRGYKIEYKKLTPHFRELEKHIHNTFENRHEWVTGDLHDIIKEIEDFL